MDTGHAIDSLALEKCSCADVVAGLLEKGTRYIVFGEGNTSFSYALACAINDARRVITTFESVEPEVMFDHTEQLLYSIENLEIIRKQGVNWHFRESDPLGILHRIIDIRNEMKLVQYMTHINVQHIAAHSTKFGTHTGMTVYWFQCPWTVPPRKLHDLLLTFLTEGSSTLCIGDKVFIGVCEGYDEYYGLSRLLKYDSVQSLYEFSGVDNLGIQRLIGYGYHHATCHQDKDIHKKVFNSHRTLVFKRK